MQYGAMNFPVRPTLSEVESIAGLGFDYVELTMDPPQAHHSTIREQHEELNALLSKLNVGLICHLPSFLCTADLTPRLREASNLEVIDCLETAAMLNPLKIVLHPSYITGLGALVPDLCKRYAHESLKLATQKASDLGLTICLENMFDKAGVMIEPEEFEEVLEKFPSLKLTLDIGHANISGSGQKRTLNYIRRLGDRIGHVHVSDNFGKADNHLPIGAGRIDFPKIMKALKKTGYDDTITLEIFSRDQEYLWQSRNKLALILAGC